MYKTKDDEKVRPTGGLGGLSHVDKKNPAPRPAPREPLSGNNGPKLNPRMNSPYAEENNTAPNFQTPTMQRPPTPNIGPMMQAAAPSTAISQPLGSTKSKLFTGRNIVKFGVLSGIATAGFLYYRNRSVEEFAADIMEDDE